MFGIRQNNSKSEAHRDIKSTAPGRTEADRIPEIVFAALARDPGFAEVLKGTMPSHVVPGFTAKAGTIVGGPPITALGLSDLGTAVALFAKLYDKMKAARGTRREIENDAECKLDYVNQMLHWMDSAAATLLDIAEGQESAYNKVLEISETFHALCISESGYNHTKGIDVWLSFRDLLAKSMKKSEYNLYWHFYDEFKYLGDKNTELNTELREHVVGMRAALRNGDAADAAWHLRLAIRAFQALGTSVIGFVFALRRWIENA